MAYKFLTVAKNPTLNMVKVEIEEGKPVWVVVEKNVLDFAKKNFNEGDEVEFEYYTDKSKKVHVKGYIKKVGGTDTPAPKETTSRPTETPAPQSNPVKTNAPEKKTWGKTPEEQDSIKRQAIGHMVSRTLISLQGHVDPNNVHEIATELYKTYQELVG